MAHTAPPTRTYLHDIPSLHASNPGLPAVLGDLDLNLEIRAGLPMNPDILKNAKSVAKVLRAIHDNAGDDRVTAVVAENAELRAAAVEAAHVSAAYTPIDIAQALGNLTNQVTLGFAQMNQRFDAMDLRFDTLDLCFDALDSRFDAMDSRFDAMDLRFDAMERRLDVVQAKIIPFQS